MVPMNKGKSVGLVLAVMMVLGILVPSACSAEMVAAYEVYQQSFSYYFGPLESHSGIDNVSYSAGSGLNFYGYIDSMCVGNFSADADMATALAANSYLELSFDTAGYATITSYDMFYMNNYLVVTHEEGLPTFDMGLAYDNGSGSFSETISGISPDDIADGIDISGFSAGQADSTVRFRVVFYNDHRSSGGTSALFFQNGDYSGVSGAAVVFSGTVAIPEPATLALMAAGGFALLYKRRR